MRLLPILLLSGLLVGCAAQVTHPTKSVAEMQVDIDRCTTRANHKYWMDPVAALYNAYDCLEELGYRRADANLSAKVRKAVGETHPSTQQGTPCQVPCTNQR